MATTKTKVKNEVQERLAKARAARASGAKRKAPPKLTFKAPVDFVTALYDTRILIGTDGLLQGIQCTRIQGNYETAPDNKRRNVQTYDPKTLALMASRIGSAIMAPVKSRLPARTVYRVLYRVSRRKDDTIGVTVAWIVVETKERGQIVEYALERSDPEFRRIRKSTQTLPAAFIKAITPAPLGRDEVDDTIEV